MKMTFAKLITLLVSILTMLIPNFKKPDSVAGIKEINDVLLAMNATALFMAARLKDGIGFDDAAAFIAHITADDQYKKLIAEAYDKYALIPAELKDIDTGEGLELVSTELKFIPELLAILKKEA